MQNIMLNLFLVADALIVIPLLILAVTVLLHGGYKLKQNVALMFFSVLVAVWIIANHLGNDLSTPPQQAIVANYFVFFCSFTAMILIMLFIVQLTGNKRLVTYTNWTLPVLGIIALLAATPLMGEGVVIQENIYGVVFGPLLIPYGLALVYMIAFTLIVTRYGLRHTRGIRNNQLQVIGTALALALPLMLVLSFILPSVTGAFWLTEFGVMPLSILVASLYYSVIRHKLFDVRFVVVRSVAYICVLASLSIVYYLLAYVISVVVLQNHASDSVSVSPLNILLALLLTIIFQPIKRFFDHVTDKYFYKDNYKSVDFIKRLNILLTSTTDLRGLLERIATEIADTLKSDQVFFFLYQDGHAHHHLSSGTSRHSKLPIYDARQLDEFARDNDEGVFLTDTLSGYPDIRRLLVSHKISVLVPLKSADKITGYLFLGERRSGNYTKRDLNVLATISSELLIAIQNALSLHEVKELNATLQQRIDVATKELRSSNAQLKHLDEVKDEFMSMASHQLRTPLTSVKGYLSMVLDGDVGKVTPQQRKLLTEAFGSSERMVRMIADFLNVSRLQTGKFTMEKTDIEFRKIVKQEVEHLKLVAGVRNLKLELVASDQDLHIHADEAKLREVVMNFIDNAIYYSKPDSTIKISLTKHARYIELTVSDTGIGVPKEEQARLFNKFFRATNARKQRPDGTGVGLFLSRKVILAHGGEMIVHSVEGRGSTFGFRLPLTTTK